MNYVKLAASPCYMHRSGKRAGAGGDTPSTDAVAGVAAISSTGSAKNLLHDREYCIFRDGNLNRERGRRERVTCGNGIDCEFDRKSFASPFRFQLDSVEKETVTKVKAGVVRDQWGR